MSQSLSAQTRTRKRPFPRKVVLVTALDAHTDVVVVGNTGAMERLVRGCAPAPARQATETLPYLDIADLETLVMLPAVRPSTSRFPLPLREGDWREDTIELEAVGVDESWLL